VTRTAEQIVLDFAAAFPRKDIDYLVEAMSEDCVYANVPLPPLRGRAAFRDFTAPALARADRIEFIMLHIATARDGLTVLTERIDVFHYGAQRVSVPLMGIFVVRDGRIAEWRDYADLSSFLKQMAAIGQTPQISRG
jgi:limonene-1,2-epoxide hydrolase